MALTRLKKRSEFLRVAGKGVVAKTSTMLVQCCPSLEKSDKTIKIRVGFTASRRVGNAVKRNKAKRRLRALACQYLSKKLDETYQGVFPFDLDFVLIAVPATVTADFQCLERDFLVAIRRCLKHLPAFPESALEYMNKGSL